MKVVRCVIIGIAAMSCMPIAVLICCASIVSKIVRP